MHKISLRLFRVIVMLLKKCLYLWVLFFIQTKCKINIFKCLPSICIYRTKALLTSQDNRQMRIHVYSKTRRAKFPTLSIFLAEPHTHIGK